MTTTTITVDSNETEILEDMQALLANGEIKAALQEEKKDDSKTHRAQTSLDRMWTIDPETGRAVLNASNIREDMAAAGREDREKEAAIVQNIVEDVRAAAWREDREKEAAREKKAEGNKKRKSLLKGGQGTTNPLPPTRKQKANQAMYGLENMASSYINPYSDPTRSLLGTVGRLQVGNKVVDPNALNLLHNANNTLDKIVSGTVGALIPGGSTPLRDLIERRRARQSSGQDAYDENVEALSRSDERSDMAEGGDIDAQMETLMPTEEMHSMPDGTQMPGATHEEYEATMSTDEDMEDGYLDFILDEALEDEEEAYLMEQLESNDKLSLIFDKVIDVATEFAGSGPVNGPGSGVSDSIPARLSDGEFVFTAKATEELGADNLEAIMREAEVQADGRQQAANGGYINVDRDDDTQIPIQTTESARAQSNVQPVNRRKTVEQLEEEMLKSNPRRRYAVISG